MESLVDDGTVEIILFVALYWYAAFMSQHNWFDDNHSFIIFFRFKCVARVTIVYLYPMHSHFFHINNSATILQRKMAKKKQKRVSAPTSQQEDLDRFAGSSEEEDSDDEKHDTCVLPVIDYKADVEDEDDAESSDEESMKNGARAERKQIPENTNPSSSDSDEFDDDEDHNSGMANAMAKILGTSIKNQITSVVLSKTKTPLQRQIETEMKREKEMKEKRALNREKILSALHIPLSVATSNHLEGSLTLHSELKQERAHRRIATRGIVALFNAIAQHQHGHEASGKAKANDTPKAGLDGTKLTKHSFLDMIKNKAKETAVANAPVSSKEDGNKKQWNALREDYMLDSKKRDWDEDDSSVDGEMGEDDVSDESVGEKDISPTKKRKAQA
jgi:hypothetical protein